MKHEITAKKTVHNLIRLSSERPLQYGHVSIGNTPGIDSPSQYTVYTVTEKTYICYNKTVNAWKQVK